MKNNNLTALQLSVLDVIKEKPLTSFQILSKVDDISMILSLYTVIDQLKSKGAIESYTKKNMKYHIAC